MSGTNADIDIEGAGAQAIAGSVADALGLGTEDVTSADIEFSIGDPKTTVAVGASGERTGAVLADLLGDQDWSNYDVRGVSATVESDESDAQSNSGEDEGDGSSRESLGYQPQVTPLAGEVKPQLVEFPGGEPGRIRENTQMHRAAHLLMEWYNVREDKEWVTAEELGDFAGDDMTETQVRGAIGRLFSPKAMLVRRQVKDTPGLAYEYNPTEELADEVRRLGDPFDARDRSTDDE